MKMIFAVVLLAFVASPVFSDESLSTDEQVQFVRGLAHFNEAGEVEAQITAWVYEHEQRPGAKTAFAKLIGVDLDTLTEQEAAFFDYRTQLFRFDSESGKRLRLQWADGRQQSLPLTDADGISSYHVRLGPLADLAIRKTSTKTAVLDFQAVLPKEDKRQFSGQLLLVPDAGLSVVSDIDDTIKISNVRDHAELLRNTFLREFKPVPGMAAYYLQLAAQADTTRFHYLSSSPHQLYPALDAFLQGNGFPLGSVHLRHIDILDEVLGDGDSSRRHKLATLQQLFSQFPERRFLLIGDSGEADPEIYAEIAKRYPKQTAGIRIRDVTGENATAQRYAKTFAGLDAAMWRVFTSAEALAKSY